MPLDPEDQVPTLDDERGARAGQPSVPLRPSPMRAPAAPFPAPQAGSPPPAPQAGRPQRIGPFEVLGELGRGGMGAVFRARHSSLGREVALKVLLAGAGASAKARERFLREGRLMASLKHSHILSVHDVGESPLGPYLVLDLVDGVSLAEVGEDRLPPERVAEIGAKIADALECAHEHGVLHRDVKPHNILLRRDGEPFLTDFGVARLEHGERLTKTGQAVGTPVYSAPELAVGEHRRVDRRSDVYGLGVTLYEVLTGEVPFEAESAVELIRKIACQEPRRPSLLSPLLDSDLETIVLCCLEKEPADRYESAAALGSDLRRYLRGEPIFAKPPTLGDRLAKWRRRNRGLTRALILGVVLLLAGGLTAGGLFVRRLEGERALAEAAREDALDAEARAKAEKASALQAREEAQVARARSEAKSAELAQANQALAVQLKQARVQVAGSLDLQARLARRQHGWGEAALFSASALALEDSVRRRYAFAQARRKAWRGVALGAEVRNAAWGRDGVLALANPKGRVRLVKCPSVEGMFSINAHSAGEEAPSLAWAPGGRLLASWRAGEHVALISPEARQGLQIKTQGRLESVHWLSEGLMTVSKRSAGTVLQTWTLAGKLRGRVEGPGLEPLVTKSGRYYVTQRRSRAGCALLVYDATGARVADLGVSEEPWNVSWSGDALVINGQSGLSLVEGPAWQPKALPAPPPSLAPNQRPLVLADPAGAAFLVHRPGNDLVVYKDNAVPVPLRGMSRLRALSWGAKGAFVGQSDTGEVRIWQKQGSALKVYEIPPGYRRSRVQLVHGSAVLTGAPGILVVRSRHELVRLAGPSVEASRALVAPPFGPEAVVVLNQRGAHLWFPKGRGDPIWTLPERVVDLAFSEEGVLAVASGGLKHAFLIGLQLPGRSANDRVPLPSPINSLDWKGSVLAASTTGGVSLIDASKGDIEAQWPAQIVAGGVAAWSPGGKLLAAPCGVEGRVELRVFDRKGRVATRLAIPAGAVYVGGSLRWSPQGRRIAFLVRSEGRVSLMACELQSGKSWTLQGVLGGGGRRTYGPLSPAPLAWSPTSELIAVAGNKELLFVNAAEGKVRDRLAAPEGRWVSGLVAWSARGDRLVWGTTATGCVLVATEAPSLIKRLHAAAAEWSPSGDVLATVSGRGFNLLDAEGRTLRRLQEGGTFVRWAPRGNQVAYGAGNKLKIVAHAPYRGPAGEALTVAQGEMDLKLEGVQIEAPRKD